MLLNFKTKNFRSFKELVDLNMIKGSTRKHDERIAEIGNSSVLKFSSIYGPNASGKSNLVMALKVMQYIVLNNRIPTDAFKEYFRLDDSCANKSTYFETIISVDNEIFSYGFEINLYTGIIHSEWLINLKKKKDGQVTESLLFTRDENKIDYHNKLSGYNGTKHMRLEICKEDILKNKKLLLLRRIIDVFSNVENPSDRPSDVFDVYNWFNINLKVVYPMGPLTTPEMIFSSVDKIKEMLKHFDTGITDIIIQNKTEEEYNIENTPSGNPSFIIKSLVDNIFIGQKNGQVMFRFPSGLWIIKKNHMNYEFNKLVFLHDSNIEHIFNSTNESDGTMRLFELFQPLMDSDNNSVYVIDELDRCLHPSLTIKYVDLFLEKAKNQNDNTQLIVTTHESRLMNLEKLRRDEIWFFEKKNNVSSLFSLEDYNVRFDNVVDKAYMEGRYGAVPQIDYVELIELLRNENNKQ